MTRWFTKKNNLTVVAVLMAVVVGAVLRLHNISDYKFYPDSYQNLVVAHNLKTSHSALGTLGDETITT